MGQKKQKLFIWLFILCAGCSSQNTLVRQPSSVTIPWGLDPAAIPESHAIQNWVDRIPPQEIDLARWKSAAIESSCADQNVYPTHPQQSTKTYHVEAVAQYSNRKMEPESPYCAITTRPSNSNQKKHCLKTYSFVYVVISDIFMNGCGDYFRGFWQVSFSSKDESMKSLFSKGRILNPKKGSEFGGEFEVGATYAVPKSEFTFFTAPFSGDIEKAKDLYNFALKDFVFHPDTHLFSRK